MKVKLKSEGKQKYLPLPQGVDTGGLSEAEIFHLKDGFYLVSFSPLPSSEHAKTKAMPKNALGLGDAESAVARKLISIRFEKRRVPKVQKLLSQQERKALDGLISRSLIKIYRGGKYSDGVYNISDRLYDYFRKKPSRNIQSQNGASQQLQNTNSQPKNAATKQFQNTKTPHPQDSNAKPKSTKPQSKPTSAPSLNSVEHLVKFGYMVLSGQNEAKRLMDEIERAVPKSNVAGVRGFDRKYYVVRKDFCNQYAHSAIMALGKSPISEYAAAEKLKLPPIAVRCLLSVMADNGEVIEKVRGRWARA